MEIRLILLASACSGTGLDRMTITGGSELDSNGIGVKSAVSVVIGTMTHVPSRYHMANGKRKEQPIILAEPRQQP